MADEHKDIDAVTGTATTGHDWDGIRELNTPLPRWWLWSFYACIIWAVGYWVVYPAWPLLTGSTEGVTAWHARSAVVADLAELKVARGPDGHNIMSLPSASSEPFTPPPGFAAALGAALGGAPPVEFHFSRKGGAGAGALIAVWPSPADIKALKPDGNLEAVLLRIEAGSLLATSKGDGKPHDFVSRFFAPYFGVPEDPVTGSAHCALTPFWAKRLGKKTLHARQASARGGDILCTDDGARTILQGPCALYLTGEIEV